MAQRTAAERASLQAPFPPEVCQVARQNNLGEPVQIPRPGFAGCSDLYFGSMMLIVALLLLSIVLLSIFQPAWFSVPPVGAILFFLIMVPLFLTFGICGFSQCAKTRRPVYELEKGFIVREKHSGKIVMVMHWDDIQEVRKNSSRYGTTYTVLGKGGHIYRPVPRRFWLRCKEKLQERSADPA